MKSLFLAITAILFTACYAAEAPDGKDVTEEKFSTAEQAIVVCSSQCAQPTYNGNPVACASNTYCFADSGGAYCQNSWGGFDTYACTPGSSGPVCGDGTCNGDETWETCFDCPAPGPVCGDGVCESWNGEDGFNCPTDCCSRGVRCEIIQP